MLPKCWITLPSLPSKYLLKFHLGAPDSAPKYLKSVLASSPRTCVGAIIVKVTPKLTKQIPAAFSSSLSSCLKSSLAKPTTTKPLSLYCLCSASKPLNCLVNPQWLAVFTTKVTLFSTNLHRSTESFECSLRYSPCKCGSQAANAVEVSPMTIAPKKILMDFITVPQG